MKQYVFNGRWFPFLFNAQQNNHEYHYTGLFWSPYNQGSWITEVRISEVPRTVIIADLLTTSLVLGGLGVWSLGLGVSAVKIFMYISSEGY